MFNRLGTSRETEIVMGLVAKAVLGICEKAEAHGNDTPDITIRVRKDRTSKTERRGQTYVHATATIRLHESCWSEEE